MLLLEYIPAVVAATIVLSSAARNAVATRWRKFRDP